MAHHDDDPDFAFEPIPGLPETLPAGETILWQGRPDATALAIDSLGLRWVAGYFVLLALWRVGVSSLETGWAEAAPLAVPFLGLGAVACAIIWGVAWVQARATLYTITTHRIAMRMGAALTLTLNLPFAKVAQADMARAPRGTGTIALTTSGGVRLSYLVLWPHVRPWRMKHTEPAMRCLPDADVVARLLAEAVETRMAAPQVARVGRPGAAAIAAE